jgi:hypothetical protein
MTRVLSANSPPAENSGRTGACSPPPTHRSHYPVCSLGVKEEGRLKRRPLRFLGKRGIPSLEGKSPAGGGEGIPKYIRVGRMFKVQVERSRT